MILADTIKGLTITIGADTKTFNKQIKQADKDIKETQKQADNLTKALQLEFDAGRFSQAQKLAQDVIEKTEAKAQALRDQLKYLEDTGVDKTSDSYKKLETQLTQTEAQAVILKNKLKEIDNLKIDSIAKQFEKVGNGISNAGKAMMPFSAAASGVLTGLTGIGLSSVSAADDIATLATQVGLSAEELQKWQYIAMQTDVTDQQLQTGLTKVQAALADMASGTTSTATNALESLGITASDAAKGMDANFDNLITKLSQIEDPILQASYANELFGDKLGSKLIPLLQSGGDGVAALSEEFENLGYLTNEQVAAFSEFDNVMNTIKYQFSNIKNQVGSALLPVMQSIADIIQNKIIPSIQKLSDWIGSLSTDQLSMILKITAVIAAIGPLLIIIGKLTTGVGGLIKSLKGVHSILGVLSAHPIIAIIGLVATLLTILYTKNESFRKSINGLVTVISGALQPILEVLMKVLNPIMDAIGTLINLIGDILTPIIEIFSASLTPIIERLKLMFEIMKPLIQLALIPLQAQLNALQIPLQILGELLNMLTPLFNAFGNMVKGVFKGVISWINKLLKIVEDSINWIIDKINEVISGLNYIPGVNISKIGKVSLKISGEVSDEPYEEIAENIEKGATQDAVEGTSVEDVIKETPIEENNYVINNDYSDKNITINVTVENYAEELDYDNLVEQINLKLAEQM